MRQRSRFFLVVLMLMFAGNIFSQINLSCDSYLYAKKLKSFTTYNSSTAKFEKINLTTPSCNYHINNYNPINRTSSFNLLTPIAKNFSVMQLGIVCKKEFEFEKKTSVPLRLRLGSLDYTNYLEQKPNALRPL